MTGSPGGTARGVQIADVSKNDPITLNDTGIVVWPIPVYSWLMNQCAMTIDSRNRIHVATYHMPEPFVPDELEHNPPEHVVDRLRAYHYWRNESGTWHTSGPIQDPDRTHEHSRQRRPNIVVDEDNNVVIYEPTSLGYRCHIAGEADNFSTWKSVAMTGAEFGPSARANTTGDCCGKRVSCPLPLSPPGRVNKRHSLSST